MVFWGFNVNKQKNIRIMRIASDVFRFATVGRDVLFASFQL